MSEKKTIIAECEACNGTGLYRGWFCRDDTAVVCAKCAGTGCVEIQYIPFSSRKKEEGIKRVFTSNNGLQVYPNKQEFPDGTVIDYSKYGCTLEEWEAGKEPVPLPDFK